MTRFLCLLSLCAAWPVQAASAGEARFGMRSRPAPGTLREVMAPVVVREAPDNEAVVVRMPDDSLRVYYVKRPEGTEVRSIRSTDGGLTWGEDRLELPLPGAAYHAVQVIVARDGELHMIFHILRGSGRKPGVDRNFDVWHCRTGRGRAVWGKPRRILSGYVGSLRGLAQLRSGRLLVPVSLAVPERLQPPPPGRPDHGWHDIVVLYSDDEGQTWEKSSSRLRIVLEAPNVTRYGAIEPHVRQLKDGRVWMLIRDRCGRLYESWSADGAEWSDPRRTRFISSDSPAHTLRLADGRLVLFWCSCQRWDNPRSYAMGGREVLHAAISADEGKTWQGHREVLHEPEPPATRGDRGTAYPSAAQNAQGKIVLVSGQGEGRRAIVLLDPDWLAQTRARDDFSEGAAQWTWYGGQGAGVADHPDRPGRHVLQVRRPDAGTPAGAVWSFPAGRAGKLSLKLQLRPGGRGMTLALTDHFSVTADSRAEEHAPFALTLDGQGRAGGQRLLQPGKWHELSLRWDEAGGSVSVDGRAVLTLKRRRETEVGICYLRLSIPAPESDEAGFLIETAEAEVIPPGRVEGRPGAPHPLRLERVKGSETGGAVLDTGASGAFDADWASCPSVLRDGQGYALWYSSLYDAKAGAGGIGLARSADGVRWQRAAGGRPVLSAGPRGAFDEGVVMGPCVLREGKTWRMWYTGMPGTRHASGLGFYRIGLATSDDGVHWRRANGGRPVLDLGPPGSPDEVQAATPSVLREEDGYRMWYAAWSPRHGHTICAAQSADGLHWRRENEGRPVAGLSPALAYGHDVVRLNDRYLMVYMAQQAAPGLYAAESRDGLRWDMLNGGDAVLAPGRPAAFDDYLVGHPALLLSSGRLHLWYTGYRREPGAAYPWRLRIGLAVSSPRLP